MVSEKTVLARTIHQMIKTGNVFRDLSDNNKLYFSKHATVKNHKKGEHIWKKRCKSECCAYIFSGSAELIHCNTKGEENIQGVFGPGDLIGLPSLLRNSAHEDDALTASKYNEILYLHLKSAKMDIIGHERTNFLLWQNKQLLKSEQLLRNKLLVLSSGELQQRLIELFDQLIVRFSKETLDRHENFFIPISLTKTQLAKIIEARVETVIRILRKWERAGHLELSTSGIVLKKWPTLKRGNINWPL